eukprot:TRINITY_DN6065_c0_g1_i1.p1 TRINITY_DN6065_c0_g1~~TRINITY_DN6065_c0_g1_i1.p1  ORF type:complete len:300 (-),score=51.82 TRINITY_DN6065_c0_g1_i1:415-1314(-)
MSELAPADSVAVFKAAGSTWLDSQEFIDCVWETWPKDMIRVSMVLSIPSLLPLPSSGAIKMIDVVQLVPPNRWYSAAWNLMQRTEGESVADDSWRSSFEEMFPAGFTSTERSISNPDPTKRQVFSRFISHLKFEEDTALMHVIDAILYTIAPFTLKKVFDAHPRLTADPNAADQLWQAIFHLNGIAYDLYAGQMADLLIESKIAQTELANFEISEASPTALRKYISYYGQSPRVFPLDVLTAISWNRTKNTKNDPYALLWKEVLATEPSRYFRNNGYLRRCLDFIKHLNVSKALQFYPQ